MGIVGAIIGGAVIGGAASIYGSRQSANAIEDASNTSVAEQRRQFDISRQDLLPFMQRGSAAMDVFMQELGIPVQASNAQTGQNVDAQLLPGSGSGGRGRMGNSIRRLIPKAGTQNGSEVIGGDNMGQGPIDAGPGAFPYMAGKLGQPGGDFFGPNSGPRPISAVPSDASQPIAGSRYVQSPGYEFQVQEGQRAIRRGNSAEGRLYSGGTGRELVRYGQGVASQDYYRWLDGVRAAAGLGASTSSQAANLAVNVGSNIGRTIEGAGAGRASAYMGGAAGVNNALQGGISNYLLYRYLPRAA